MAVLTPAPVRARLDPVDIVLTPAPDPVRSFDELIAAIRADIATAGSALGQTEYAVFRDNAKLVARGDAAEDDVDEGFSFMAPPAGLECNDEDECVMPDDMYDDVE